MIRLFKLTLKQLPNTIIFMANEQTDISIIERLVKGSISFNTNEEYQNLLRDFPDNPRVHRLLADFLLENKSYVDASKEYRRAYQLFMESGMSLQGIAALRHRWDIVGPSSHDYRALHSHLRRTVSHSSALAECFAKMSYRELREFLDRSELITVPAQKVLREQGKPEDALFFIVSGEVTISSSDTSTPNTPTEARHLEENSHFGDIYPCDENKTINSLIKSVTRVELLKISREDLLAVLREFPDLEIGIKNFLRDQAKPEEDKPSKFYRKTSRRSLAIILNLEILERDPGLHPIVVKGFSSDISLGGVCVIIDPRYRDIPIKDIANRKARIRISLPDETISLIILGRLAWYKKAEIEGQSTFAVGVQFNEMPPRLRGLLIVFANAVGTMTRLLEGKEFSQDILEKHHLES